MVIDEAIASASKNSKFLHPIALKRVIAAAHQAKRLVLDEDASRMVGRFMEGCIDLIVQHRQFAMPLYDVMYIEFDTRAMYDEISGNAAGPIKKDDPEADERIGFLFDHRTVYTIANGPLSSAIMPIFNYINPRGTYETPNYGKDFMVYELWHDKQEKEPADATKLSLMLGASALRMLAATGGGPTRERAHDLILFCREVQYYYAGVKDINKVGTEGHQKIMNEIVGDVRNMYAILLWLNSLPHTVKYTNRPAGHKMYRGKRLALSAHNVVTIHMQGAVQIRNLFTKHMKERQHPRLHDVRGFWRHRFGIAQGCGHDWPATPDKRNKFVCKKCGRERWWIHEHERGDKSKGRVTKEYKAEF